MRFNRPILEIPGGQRYVIDNMVQAGYADPIPDAATWKYSHDSFVGVRDIQGNSIAVPNGAYSALQAIITAHGDGTLAAAIADLGVEKTRANKLVVLKAKRDEELITFTHDGSMFQLDEISKNNINGAEGALRINNAALPFPLQWTKLDNTEHTFQDLAAFQAFAVAAAQHIALCHGVYKALRVAIHNAADDAAAWAVDIETGWP